MLGNISLSSQLGVEGNGDLGAGCQKCLYRIVPRGGGNSFSFSETGIRSSPAYGTEREMGWMMSLAGAVGPGREGSHMSHQGDNQGTYCWKGKKGDAD